MRVQCDACGREPAGVLCCADEAALCSDCDRRVHRANKLAGKHRRVPLVSHDAGDGRGPSAPLCDVCKERRGLVFCVEDRAILCADCDEPIHSANELTARHSRFLLVGAKLSAPPATPASPSSDGSEESERVPCSKDASAGDTAESTALTAGQDGGSSISEYLTKVCPGWRVEDLLVDAAATTDWEEAVPFLDSELLGVTAAQPKQSTCVPAVRQSLMAWSGVGLGADYADMAPPPPPAKDWSGHGQVRARWSDMDALTVPQISSPPAKRARPSWASYY